MMMFRIAENILYGNIFILYCVYSENILFFIFIVYIIFIEKKIQMLLVNSMEKWEAELTPIGQKLGLVSMKRSRYQRDFLPSVLFCVSNNTHLVGFKRYKVRISVGWSTGKFNLLFLDELKSYCQIEKQIDSLLKTII